MKILLAVSGGIDSMYLAERASYFFPGASFLVAHCNFSLRGGESDGDEEFVRQWCSGRDMPLRVRRFDTAARARDCGESIEMAARRLRYSWFADLCREEGCEAVAVAHNADDNAETFLLNLLRGTGIKGLSGMSPDSRQGDLRVLRPVLQTSRAEIRDWMLSNGKKWREDSSNLDSSIKRNRIRNEVAPAFSRINPSWIRTLERDMAHLSEVGKIADDYWESALEAGLLAGDGRTVINLPVLRTFTHRRYLLFRALEPYGFPEASVDAVLRAVESPGTISGKIFEAPEWTLLASRDRLSVVPAGSLRGDGASIRIEGPGEYRIGGSTVRVSREGVPTELRQERGVQIFDPAFLPFPFVIRRWEDGDWMRPLGLGGRKKLSDIMTDLKWDLGRKAEALVLAPEGWEKGHVAALLGERTDRDVRVRSTSTETTKITISNENII